MEGFILKIFFSGLIAFVPSDGGKELTVLLVNTPHHYQLANRSMLEHHRAIFVARAATCEGACMPSEYPEVARFLFANQTSAEAVRSLDGAILGGGAWELSGADLALKGPREPLAIHTGTRRGSVPLTVGEREDFSWVPSIKTLAPSANGLKRELTAAGASPNKLVAARLRLRSGKVFTYSVIRVDAKTRPIHFRAASGDGPEAPFAQALANWVEAEIHVPGDSVVIEETAFGAKEPRRSMTLRPQEGVVEMAFLNLPPFAAPSRDAVRPEPAPGLHFQVLYELTNNPPAASKRLVPRLAMQPLASDPQFDWAALHPKQTMWSDLLENLDLSPRGKGPYDLTLCPMVRE